MLPLGPDGRPAMLPGHLPDEDGNKTCPDLGGGTNYMSPSFDPTTKLFYVTARETCAIYYAYDQKFKPGEQYTGGGQQRPRDQKNFGALRAIDPTTGQIKWEFRYTSVSSSGVLSTASGLVFGVRRFGAPAGMLPTVRGWPPSIAMLPVFSQPGM